MPTPPASNAFMPRVLRRVPIRPETIIATFVGPTTCTAHHASNLTVAIFFTISASSISCELVGQVRERWSPYRFSLSVPTRCVGRTACSCVIGGQISFGFWNCPLCKVSISHSTLREELAPLVALYEEIKVIDAMVSALAKSARVRY